MPLLGVNGVCIIAHGASSPLAIKNAIRAATESIKHEINPQNFAGGSILLYDVGARPRAFPETKRP